MSLTWKNGFTVTVAHGYNILLQYASYIYIISPYYDLLKSTKIKP